MVGKVVDDDDLVEMSIIIAHGGPSSSRFLDAYPKRENKNLSFPPVFGGFREILGLGDDDDDDDDDEGV
ncbi:hypothetical protein QQP08_017762 [Theobroma cacao]|nr:hypothetical protein QQP08_017762 [Theobroma cacao]